MKIKENFNTTLVFPILAIVFLSIAILVCYMPQVTTLDISIIKSLQKIFSFLSVDFSVKISSFTHWYIYIIVFIASIYLVYKKDFGLAILYIISNFTANGVIVFIKEIFKRHRPPIELQPFYHPQDYSFPSGHSYSIMILLGLLIYIIIKYVHNNILKYSLIIICGSIIILVGLSRLLLGVHYPTDVLAGYILGLSVISCIYIADKNN